MHADDLPIDRSTLAQLHPAQGRELAFKSYRTSQRLAGSHRMALTRPSRLPESGREYAPGDPVTLIDWKAFARTDQLIIREIRDEATARVRLYVDCGETMQWPREHVDPKHRVAAKAEIALRAALNLAHTHVRLGDLVEIWPLLPGETAPTRVLRPRGLGELVTLFDRLEQESFPAAMLEGSGRPETETERPADLCYWIGDALGPVDSVARLARSKIPVLVHVLSSLELGLEWIEGDTSYFDEGGVRKEYQGQTLRFRDNYASGLAAWRRKIEARTTASGGHYLLASDATRIAKWAAFVASLPKAR